VPGMSSPRDLQSVMKQQQQQPTSQRGAKLKQSKKPPQMLAVRGGRIVPIHLSGAPWVSPWPRGLTATPSVPSQRVSASAAASTAPPLQQGSDESKELSAADVGVGVGAAASANKNSA